MPSLLWKFLLGEKISNHEVGEIDHRVAEQMDAGVTPVMTEVEWSEQTANWAVRLVNGRVLAVRGDGSEEVAFEERGAWAAACLETWEGQFSHQLEAIRDGFHEVFPELSTRLLTWRELERRITGLPDVSVDALKKIARVRKRMNLH